MEESPNALSFELGNELSVPNNEPKLLDYIEQFQPRDINSTGGDFSMDDFDPTKNFMSTIKGPSIEAQAQAISFDPKAAQLDRYTNSTYYGQLGYDPRINNEEAYASYQTWGDMFKNAFAGAGKLAAGTFIEGWKGWGRLADALTTFDTTKLTASNEEMYEMAQQQEDIMNKYAIFKSAESEKSVLNKQFFGDLVQNSGFAVGAIGQFLSEELLTFGAATAFSATKLGIRTVESINQLQNIAEFKKLHQSLGAIWKEKGLMETLYQGAKRTLPAVNTIEKFNVARKAGAGAAQLAYIGLGGVRRVMSEYNMARSESIFEAAGTYKELKDKLVTEHMNATGEMPDANQMERIDTLSRQGAVENFGTNMGLLLLTNRLQFDNMLGKFSVDRGIISKVFGKTGAYADDFFTVTGKAVAKEGEKAAEKSVTNIYRKGMFGELSALSEVAKDFGTKKAVWEATKAVGRNTFKWETSEGLQELFQEGSNKGLQDFYYNLYHGKKGYTGKADAILKNIQNPFTDVQGAKTFLMGAVTGRLISPINFGVSKVAERVTTTEKQRNEVEADKAEALKVSRAFYSNPYSVIKEEIKNFKVQDTAAKTMEAAVDQRDKYYYQNAKGSAFASAVSYAKKTDTLDAMLDTIREYGNRLSPEEVKEAFNIDPTTDNVNSIKEYFNNIANSVEQFQKDWDRLQDKFGSRVQPELYAEGTDAKKQAQLRKFALDNYIEILATNSYKSKEATRRAYEIYTQVASNKNIGASASFAFKTLGNERAFSNEIELLTEELKGLESSENKTTEQKALIDAKKTQLEALKKWKDNWSTLIFDQKNKAIAQVYVVKKAFEKYVNAKNAESKITGVISRDDIDDTYESFIDYIKLNQDADQYTEAYNFIADPNNSETYIDRIGSALEGAYRQLREDALTELFNAANFTEPDEDEDVSNLDVEHLGEEVKDEKQVVPADFNPSELENELKDKYQEVAAEAIANGEFLQPNAFLKFNSFANEILDKYGVTRNSIKPSVAVANAETYKDVDFKFNGEQNAPNVSNNTATQNEPVKTEQPTTDKPVTPTEESQDKEDGVGPIQVGKYTLHINDILEPTTEGESTFTVMGHSPSTVVLRVDNESSIPVDKLDLEKYIDAGDLVIKKGSNTNAPATTTKVNDVPTVEEDAPDFSGIDTTIATEQWNDENGEDITTSRKSLQASGKINNVSDKYVVEKEEGREIIKRDGRNTKYPVVLGTSEIKVGTPLTVKVDTDIEDYDDVDHANNTSTKKTYTDFFGPDGKILDEAMDDFPVAIYTTVNGKEVKLGYLPTMQWVKARYSNGQTQHIVEFKKSGEDMVNNLEIQIKALSEQRKAIFDAHNNNVGITLDAVVTDKTVGMLRVSSNTNTLTDTVAPNTKLGIIKGGKVMLDYNVEFDDSDAFLPFSIKAEDDTTVIEDQYNGWPVMILPTPTGSQLVSWVGVSKLRREHSELILESWKAFHKLVADNKAGKEHNKNSKEFKLVNAIYKALGTNLNTNESPVFSVLKQYLNNYVTFMSGKARYDKLRTGYGVGNIGNNGELIVWSVISQDKTKDMLGMATPEELNKETEEQFYTITSNLYYNVGFAKDTAQGINSSKKMKFVSIEKGEVKLSEEKTYNQYMFDNLYTNLENGVPVDDKNPNSERVHFANPVVNFDFTGTETKVKEEPIATEEIKPETTPEVSSESETKEEPEKKSISDITSLLTAMNFAEGIESLGAFNNDIFLDDQDKLKSAKTTVENLKQDNTLKKDCK